MLVIHDFQPRLMSYLKPIKNKTVFVFAVDQWVFERDIDRGLLGEAIASKLIFPYHALQGEAYLHERELELKQRLVLELLENIVVNFPELANRIQILPQYFMYEVFSSRIRVFPLLAYEVADLTRGLMQNEEQALEGYRSALKRLEAQEKITQQNGYVYHHKKVYHAMPRPQTTHHQPRKECAPNTVYFNLWNHPTANEHSHSER